MSSSPAMHDAADAEQDVEGFALHGLGEHRTGAGCCCERAAPKQVERLVYIHVQAFGQNTFGLLDHDAAAQRGLQLLGEDIAAMDCLVLQQPDGGHVG